jgi:hypothetical protein
MLRYITHALLVRLPYKPTFIRGHKQAAGFASVHHAIGPYSAPNFLSNTNFVPSNVQNRRYRYITHDGAQGRYITHVFLWIDTLHHPWMLRYITHKAVIKRLTHKRFQRFLNDRNTRAFFNL